MERRICCKCKEVEIAYSKRYCNTCKQEIEANKTKVKDREKAKYNRYKIRYEERAGFKWRE